MKAKSKIIYLGKEYTLSGDLSVDIAKDGTPICYAYGQDPDGKNCRIIWQDIWQDAAFQNDTEVYLINTNTVMKTAPDYIE